MNELRMEVLRLECEVVDIRAITEPRLNEFEAIASLQGRIHGINQVRERLKIALKEVNETREEEVFIIEVKTSKQGRHPSVQEEKNKKNITEVV